MKKKKNSLFKKTFYHSLDSLQWWDTVYHFGMLISDTDEVKGGTECGSKYICIHTM